MSDLTKEFIYEPTHHADGKDWTIGGYDCRAHVSFDGRGNFTIDGIEVEGAVWDRDALKHERRWFAIKKDDPLYVPVMACATAQADAWVNGEIWSPHCRFTAALERAQIAADRREGAA